MCVSWRTENEAAPALVLDWTESGGPAATAPTGRGGFGSKLIRMGWWEPQCQLALWSVGLRAEFRAPLTEIQIQLHCSMTEPPRSGQALVLVVEDDPILMMALVDFVENAGCKAIEASTIVEAIYILETRLDIRTVFTDLDMRGSTAGMALALSIVTAGRLSSC